eukprot:s101_g36.t1
MYPQRPGIPGTPPGVPGGFPGARGPGGPGGLGGPSGPVPGGPRPNFGLQPGFEQVPPRPSGPRGPGGPGGPGGPCGPGGFYPHGGPGHMAPMPFAGSQGFGLPMSSAVIPQGPRSPAPFSVGPRPAIPSHWGFGTPSGKDPLLSEPPEQQTERPETTTNDDVDIDDDDADSHHDHHGLWIVKAIETNPWRLLFGGFGCLASCFLLIAILLLMGVRILDPRPNDIVPVILREHIAKKRQDAGRSIKEVALACPGCEHLEERSERMFYLHIIYEVERESGTLWETDILRRIHDIERKIFEARGPGPDGKEWAFTDMCLLVKPDEQLKILGREFSDEPRCAFALSPLLFLADTMLPLADPPPFKMQSTVRNGYIWINETHHAWTDAVSRCAVPPEDAQKARD